MGSDLSISGFRDTYLGRQVVSRPGGPRAGMGSAGCLGALRAPLAGFGAEPQPKSNLLPFSPEILHQVATISIIFNAMQTTNFKVKNIWGGNASPASPLNPPMDLSVRPSVTGTFRTGTTQICPRFFVPYATFLNISL